MTVMSRNSSNGNVTITENVKQDAKIRITLYIKRLPKAKVFHGLSYVMNSVV